MTSKKKVRPCPECGDQFPDLMHKRSTQTEADLFWVECRHVECRIASTKYLRRKFSDCGEECIKLWNAHKETSAKETPDEAT